MKNIHVLYGFSSEVIADSIERSLRSIGYKVSSTMRPTKLMLKEYAEEHLEVDAVVLKEFLDGGDKYSINELVELVDNVNSHVKFIVILSPSYKGKDAMKELYSAGILDVVFSDGKKGVDPDRIAELAVYGRTRREAREYYKITQTVLKHHHLTHAERMEMNGYLKDGSSEENLMERFETVSRWVTSEQMADFITMMPEELMEELKGFREYYDIHNQLYRQGFLPDRLRCPKDAVKGLSGKDSITKDKKSRKKRTKETVEDAFDIETPEPQVEYAGDNSMPIFAMDDNDDEEPPVEPRAGMGDDLEGYINRQKQESAKQYEEPLEDSPPSNVEEPVQEEPDYSGMDVDSLIGLL